MLFRTRILTSVGAALGSAMCWNRELIMQERPGPWRRGSPQTCSLRAGTLPHPGPRVLHEGQGICLLHETVFGGKRRTKGGSPGGRDLCTCLEGNYLLPSHAGWSPFAPPSHSPHFLTPLYVRKAALSGPYRLPDGFAQREMPGPMPGRGAGEGVYSPGCRLTPWHSSPQRALPSCGDSPVPCPFKAQSGIMASCCC